MAGQKYELHHWGDESLTLDDYSENMLQLAALREAASDTRPQPVSATAMLGQTAMQQETLTSYAGA